MGENNPFTRRSQPYNYGIELLSSSGDLSLLHLTPSQMKDITQSGAEENTNLEETIGCLRTLEGVNYFISSFEKDEIWPLVRMVDDKRKHISTRLRYALVLTNLTSHKGGAKWFMSQNSDKGNIVKIISEVALNSNSEVNSFAFSILNNISSNEACVDAFLTDFLEDNRWFSKSLDYLHSSKIELAMQGLPFLFANLSTSPTFRRKLLENDFNFLCNRLMLPSHSESTRLALFSMMKNMVKDTDLHDRLLQNEDILGNLLSALLVTTDFKPDVRQKMPMSLQYISSARVPEPCWDIRLVAAEGIFQLCCKKESREYLRNRATYEFLKEFFEWEENETVKDQILGAIDIIIKTEDEIGVDNYNDLDLSSMKIKEDAAPAPCEISGN